MPRTTSCTNISITIPAQPTSDELDDIIGQLERARDLMNETADDVVVTISAY